MTVFFGVAEEFQARLMESITVSKNVGDILENILVTRGEETNSHLVVGPVSAKTFRPISS